MAGTSTVIMYECRPVFKFNDPKPETSNHMEETERRVMSN